MAIQVFKSQQRGSEPDDRPPGGRCAARCAFAISIFFFLRARVLLHIWLHSWLGLFLWRPRVHLFALIFVAARWLWRAGLTCVANRSPGARAAAAWTKRRLGS